MHGGFDDDAPHDTTEQSLPGASRPRGVVNVTTRGTWKAFERRLARDVGTQRIPVTGERDGADFSDGLCVYQAKLGRRMPAYLRAWLRGIRSSGARRSRVGVVVWRPLGARDDDAVVVLSWKDWRELHGPARANASAEAAPYNVPAKPPGTLPGGRAQDPEERPAA